MDEHLWQITKGICFVFKGTKKRGGVGEVFSKGSDKRVGWWESAHPGWGGGGSEKNRTSPPKLEWSGSIKFSLEHSLA